MISSSSSRKQARLERGRRQDEDQPVDDAGNELVAACLVLLRRLLERHDLDAAVALTVAEWDPKEALAPVVTAEVAVAVLAAPALVLAL